MNLPQTYQEFAKLQIAEKYSMLENFPEGVNFAKIKELKLKKLFRNIFEEESNNYLRAKSLDILYFLILERKINNQSLVDTLHDIEHDDDVFILTRQIKYLFLLYPHVEGSKSIIRQLTSHQNGDVCSEAYYRLGLINLFHYAEITTPEDFALHLKNAQKHFLQSLQSTENRVDAEYFNFTCEFLIFLLSRKTNSANKVFQKMSTMLKNRVFLSLNNSLPTLDLKIYTLLLSLYKLCNHLNTEWDNISNEIKLLFLYQERFANLTLNNELLNTFKGHLSEKVLNSYYLKNKDIRIEKIDMLLSQLEADDLRKFLIELRQDILNNSVKKKKNSTSLLLKLVRQFPHISEKQFESDISQTDLGNPDEVVDLVLSYSNLDNKDKVLFMYSSLQALDFGQEIKGIKQSLEAFNSSLIFITEESVLIEEVAHKLTKHQPCILHLSTHGSQNEGLLFKDQYEQEVGLQVEHFIKYIQILNEEKKVLEGVILNACYSSEFAKEISRFVKFSIGMLGEIPDEISLPFTDIFYKHLSNGLEARQCFEFAKIHLDTLDIEWQSEEEGVEKLSDIPKFYSQI